MKVLKGIATAALILGGIAAAAINETQDAEWNQRLVSSLSELFRF